MSRAMAVAGCSRRSRRASVGIFLFSFIFVACGGLHEGGAFEMHIQNVVAVDEDVAFEHVTDLFESDGERVKFFYDVTLESWSNRILPFANHWKDQANWDNVETDFMGRFESSVESFTYAAFKPGKGRIRSFVQDCEGEFRPDCTVFDLQQGDAIYIFDSKGADLTAPELC